MTAKTCPRCKKRPTRLRGWCRACYMAWCRNGKPKPGPPAPPKAPADCGTPAAYRRHRRRGEEPCQPCREAVAAYQRTYRATARQQTMQASTAAGRIRQAEQAALAELGRRYPTELAAIRRQLRSPR